MIILRGRSLIIPNDEYNLGNDYDTNTATRVFQLERVTEGVDLANLAFKLDLTYADGTSDTLALDSEVEEDKINLTWTVTKSQLHIPGTIVVQIRALNADGNMKWTSYIGAFFAEASLFGGADYSGKLSEIEQFEFIIGEEKKRIANEKARQEAEATRVSSEKDRVKAEKEREDAEDLRNRAEKERVANEKVRVENEADREEWYGTAKETYEKSITAAENAEKSAESAKESEKTIKEIIEHLTGTLSVSIGPDDPDVADCIWFKTKESVMSDDSVVLKLSDNIGNTPLIAEVNGEDYSVTNADARGNDVYEIKM